VRAAADGDDRHQGDHHQAIQDVHLPVRQASPPYQVVRPGQLAYLGLGRDQVVLSAADPTRVLLLGGEPLPEPVLMWWNFVVRGREELDSAYRQWESGGPRFGRLRSPLARIPAPPPFWAPPA
jgi:quercetin 2,3-dioxygenase